MLDGLKRASEIVETEIRCEMVEDNFRIRGLRTALRFINEEIKTIETPKLCDYIDCINYKCGECIKEEIKLDKHGMCINYNFI